MLQSERKTTYGQPILTWEQYDELAEREDVTTIEDNGLSGNDQSLRWYTAYYADGTQEDFYLED